MKFKEPLFFMVLFVSMLIGLIILNTPPDIKTICKHYSISCEVVDVHIPNKPPNAFVIRDKPIIYRQNNIQNILSKAEMNSILYHELGHLVLQHEKRAREAERINKAVYGKSLSKEAKCHLERQFEFEADQFSVQVSKQFNTPSMLDETFERLGMNKDVEYCSHPSFNRRIEMIKYWEDVYDVTKKN